EDVHVVGARAHGGGDLALQVRGARQLGTVHDDDGALDGQLGVSVYHHDAQLAHGDGGEGGHGGAAARAVPGGGGDDGDAGSRASHDAAVATDGSGAAARAPSEAREGQSAPRRVFGERLERNRGARLDRHIAWRHVAAGDRRGGRGRDAG